MAPSTILIVGAGFSGLAVALRLHAFSQVPLNVYLVDRRGEFGPGLAYSNLDSVLTMGGLASRLSAFEGAENHFLDWLTSPSRHYRRGDPAPSGADYYATRQAYGDYLRKLGTTCNAASGAGVIVHKLGSEVVDAEADGSQFVISLREGTKLLANAMVLALGYPRPKPLNASFSAPSYLDNPWDFDALRTIGTSERVLIVGTGQSMMDVCVMLASLGHKGPIHAVSRRGLVAHVHAKVESQYALDVSRLPTRLRPLLAHIRRAAREWQATGGDWRAVMNSLRPHTQSLWSNLPTADKKQFQRHLKPFWQIHRTRVPEPVAQLLQRLCASGQLQLVAGQLTEAICRNSQYRINIRPRSSTNGLSLNVDRIINCSGPNQDYSSSSDDFVRSLVRRGLIRPHPSGLGIDVETSGVVIDSRGVSTRNLFAIGPPCEGALLEITVVREIRRQAHEIALRLLREVAGSSALPSVSEFAPEITS